MVERRSPKPKVAGSIPVSPASAAIAQLVERIHGKDEVTGSTPVRGSISARELGSCNGVDKRYLIC